jgi:hypothetical protein
MRILQIPRHSDFVMMNSRRFPKTKYQFNKSFMRPKIPGWGGLKFFTLEAFHCFKTRKTSFLNGVLQFRRNQSTTCAETAEMFGCLYRLVQIINYSETTFYCNWWFCILPNWRRILFRCLRMFLKLSKNQLPFF